MWNADLRASVEAPMAGLLAVSCLLLAPAGIEAQYYPIAPDPVPSALGEAVRHGSGPDTLILIPCASCRWRSFDQFMARNADRYTMYGITLPGYGGTSSPELPMWTDSTLWRDHAVDAISELLDDEGIGGAVVIGASYGTTVGIEVAARRPDVIRGLVNLDGGMSGPPGQDTLSMDQRLENARAVMEQYAHPLVEPDRWQPFNTPAMYHHPQRRLLYHGWFMATDPQVMMQYWRENLLADGNRALESLDIPILDVRAIRPWDPTPEETRRTIEEVMEPIGTGEYQLVFLYDTPHFIMEERPGLLDTLVAGFLAGAPASDFRPETTDLVGLAPAHVREHFAAGIEALHNFWYGEAEARFRAVQRGAPRFTLGYWGEALSLHRDPFGHREPPVDSIRAILSGLAPSPVARSRRARTGHERMYLDALEILIAEEDPPAERHPAYAAAMRDLSELFPEDTEAKAFLARALLLVEPSFGRSREIQAAVAEASRQVLNADPDHPGGLHYLIHGLDRPETAQEALREADRYAEIARGASHAIHMPSHIYMQLGRWDDVVASNRAAVTASRRWLARSNRPTSGIDVHALDFLLYAFLQQGREADARELLDEMQRLTEAHDSGTLRWMNALFHARYAMELGRRSTVPLPRSGYASPGEILALGLHATEIGDLDRAESLLREMEEMIPEDRPAAWQVSMLELRAGLAAARGQREEAVRLLREAVPLQVDMPRPNETADPAKPPEELLGEVLLALGRPHEADQAFSAGQARWPGRLATRLGRARAAAAQGDDDAARRRYRTLLEQLRHAAPDHPAVVEAQRALEPTPAGGVG